MTLHEQIKQYYPQYSDIQHYPADKCACIRETTAEWGIFGIKSEYAARRGMNIKMHMKPIYKSHPEWLRDEWGAMVVDAMRFCLQTKYDQCEAFRKELERSKGLFIVEDETKRNQRKKKDADSWGTNLVGNEYVGPNLLGRLLMELRDTRKLEYQLPDDALTFLQYLK